MSTDDFVVRIARVIGIWRLNDKVVFDFNPRESLGGQFEVFVTGEFFESRKFRDDARTAEPGVSQEMLIATARADTN